MKLETFLNAKPLFYDKIDYTRFPRIYAKIKHHFSTIKTVHIVGTNGKGTTGRFLATALHNLGYSVGHYTSPHILKFNERIWIDGYDAKNEVLEDAHIRLLTFLDDTDREALSYFEYTSLLAMLVFINCEYVVLEAGLGGEHDATAVFPKVLTLVTPIDIDHEAFLGSTIQEIALTKLNAIQNSAIIATQKHKAVYDVAKKKSDADSSLDIKKIQEVLDAKDIQDISLIAKRLSLAGYLEQNLSLSIAALKFFNLSYNINIFNNSKLFGRLSQYKKNIIIDVGHNLLAAHSIVAALSGNKYILIYNSYQDKDYKQILSVLKPIINYVEIIDIDDERRTSIESLQNVLIDLKIKYSKFNNIDMSKNYLVFGSFSVAESFLREYNG